MTSAYRLIVGLGNPGEKYINTRHNVGFYLLDRYASANKFEWKFDKKFNAEITNDSDTYFMKPQTFMNNSGESVKKFVDYYGLDLKNLLVIHDDVDLPVGEYKKQFGRGSAGHRGVQNIIDLLGTNEFERLRIGVGKSDNPNINTDTWVLMKCDFEDMTLPEDEAFLKLVL